MKTTINFAMRMLLCSLRLFEDACENNTVE